MGTVIQASGAALLAIALTACGSPTAENPYAAEFAQAIEGATSEFEREVLADSVIDRTEYEEAVQRYVSCLTDAGVTVAIEDQFGYYVYEVTSDVAAYDQIRDQCSSGTVAWIESLYVAQSTNPDKLELGEATARCFVGMKLVAEPFGAEEFRQLLAASGADSSEEASQVPIDPKAVEIMGSQEAQACMANPAYYRTHSES